LVKTIWSTHCGRESRQIRVIEQRSLTICIPDAITPCWQKVVIQVTDQGLALGIHVDLLQTIVPMRHTEPTVAVLPLQTSRM
jgi:hypothetical protein